MPPLGLSAVVRKVLGRKTFAPAAQAPPMVAPLARYRPRPHDAVLVLQNGPNPSTDYYLRPRLEGAETPVAFADLDTTPGRCELLGRARSLMVVFCRYAAVPWLEALEAAQDRLARVAFFMDDDLPGMIAAPDLPRDYRRRLSRRFGEHALQLSGVASEVWVSTPTLAQRYAGSRPQVLPPLPDEDPPAPSADARPRVVYHSTGVHGPERRFVVEVARRLAEAGSPAVFEITGDAPIRRACAGLAKVEVVPQLSWPTYLERQRRAVAAISLAPLHPSAINEARAPVKAFEAARLGAAGLYADTAPYRGFVRQGEDGLMLPMEVEAWARAIADLLDQPQRRMALATAARTRMIQLRRDGGPLPPPAT